MVLSDKAIADCNSTVSAYQIRRYTLSSNAKLKSTVILSLRVEQEF